MRERSLYQSQILNIYLFIFTFDKKQEQVILTKNEKNFLSLLCENRNMYFSKYDISEHLYDSSDKLNNVRTLISRLKSKTSTNLIETVFDEGYKIKLR